MGLKMRKKVRPLFSAELPEPFKTYWNSPDRLPRPEWKFFDVEGELYIEENYSFEHPPILLNHWTQACCCGVQVFMRKNKIEKRRDMPLVARDGTFLFEIRHTDDYETSAIHPVTKQKFFVHSG